MASVADMATGEGRLTGDRGGTWRRRWNQLSPVTRMEPLLGDRQKSVTLTNETAQLTLPFHPPAHPPTHPLVPPMFLSSSTYSSSYFSSFFYFSSPPFFRFPPTLSGLPALLHILLYRHLLFLFF